MSRTKKLSLSLLFVFAFVTFFNPLAKAFADESISSTKADLKVGQVYHGFKLTEQENLEDFDGIGRIFVHEKTGAKLFQLQNNDKNKTFVVSFRTPVDNNTGKPHILEHALLLGGSEKYPIKQLMTQIDKGALTNLLNGWTFSDKTAYPFSTVNDEEFNNIMDIYLDMAYNARIKEIENIFDEEAWHHEIFNENDPIKYTGVVFNEMKGALSSSDRIFSKAIDRSLYPDTVYNFLSGGDPKHIPELTYEELVEFYETYYHPSNSYIYLYGDMDILEKLKLIDENQLSAFSKKDIDSTIKPQTPFTKPVTYEADYSIPADASTDNATYLSLNFSVGESKDVKNILTISMLDKLVFDNPASPLIKNLHNAGFDTVNGSYSLAGIQPTISIIAKNTDASKKAEFEKIVFDSLKQIVNEGIDAELLESTLNSFVLEDKLAKSYNKDTGINLYHSVALELNYDGNVFDMFNTNSIIEGFKKATETKYFETFLQEKIIDNNFRSLVVLNPVPGLSAKEQEAEAKKLAEYKESLSEEELANLIKENKALVAWQNAPDNPEDLAKLPKLKLNELTPKVETVPTEIKNIGDVKVLYHPAFTFGTNKLNMFFDSTYIKQEQLPYINLLTKLIGNLDTVNFKYTDIPKESLKYTNGISISPANFRSSTDTDVYSPKVQVSFTSLNENMNTSIKLVEELLFNTKYEDKNRIRTLLANLLVAAENDLYNSAYRYVNNENMAKFSDAEAYSKDANYYGYYELLVDLNKNFDTKFDEMVATLKEVSNTLFIKNNLVVSATLEEKHYDLFEKNITKILENLDTLDASEQKYKFNNVAPANTGYTFGSQVNYISQAFNINELGYKLDASPELLTTIVNSFLWQKMRVEGGAYGAYLWLYDSGNVAIFTYRDPRVAGSFEDLEILPIYLSNIELPEAQLEQFKISALAGYYTPSSVFEKASAADSRYFLNINEKDIQKEIDRIMNTSIDDIRKFGEIMHNGLRRDYKSVIGNNSTIEDANDLFPFVLPFILEK
ncbi:insulinase family protein [Oceanirhabdus sp. W0125-5]|uniref:insulinase family protein n=1 Tax=Oceanirhabdus sp. W0125-5 TaxID=2999116 RepID=UPI0022F340EB|nr:insulinase family protein [Oceanirhabdus sp. W0125-5]WBW99126.1 insulinase family protein [Oceanirhabdus sp. W0125-5]